jgi:hypothetical protein
VVDGNPCADGSVGRWWPGNPLGSGPVGLPVGSLGVLWGSSPGGLLCGGLMGQWLC